MKDQDGYRNIVFNHKIFVCLLRQIIEMQRGTDNIAVNKVTYSSESAGEHKTKVNSCQNFYKNRLERGAANGNITKGCTPEFA